jgi:microcystin-dependent protein
MGGGTMNPAVNPGGGNPNYTINFTTGQNTVLLSSTEIPSHTHTATATSTADPHNHFIAKSGANIGDLTSSSPLDTLFDNGNTSYNLKSTSGTANLGPTSNATVNVTTSVVVSPTGGGVAHNNIQPTIGAYYIMFIP